MDEIFVPGMAALFLLVPVALVGWLVTRWRSKRTSKPDTSSSEEGR